MNIFVLYNCSIVSEDIAVNLLSGSTISDEQTLLHCYF